MKHLPIGLAAYFTTPDAQPVDAENPVRQPGHLTSALIQARAGCKRGAYMFEPHWVPGTDESDYYVSLHSFHFAFTAKCFV